MRLVDIAQVRRLGISLLDLVENVSMVDKIWIAGEGDGREGGRRRFRVSGRSF